MDHIAVLFCDSPDPVTAEKYGDFGELCVDLLKKGNCKLPGIKYTVYFQSDDDAEDEKNLNEVYLQLLDNLEKKHIKGILLSGSRADSFDNTKLWINRLDEFLRNIILPIPDFPIIGICFGHQIICKNLGCKVDRNISENGWECGIATISLNPEIFSIKTLSCINDFKQQLALDNKINDHLNLPEIHRDIVYGLPEGKSSNFISIGSTAKCSIQGIITESGPMKILTFQGHPEFSSDLTIDSLEHMYKTSNAELDKTAFEKGIYNTKILNNQGPLVGLLITSFINSLI